LAKKATWNLVVMTQMSTSVKQTTEIVALMPAAATPRAASLVTVYLDTTEMESIVEVGLLCYW